MRKIALILLALALAATGCMAAKNTPSIEEIAAANEENALLSRHAAFAVSTLYYDQNGGETFSTYQALGKSGDNYAATYEDADGYKEYLDGALVYSYNPSAQKYAVTAFYPGMLDEYVASFDDYLFLHGEGSTIEGDRSAVSVTLPREEFNSAFMDSLGFGTPDSLRIQYALDPDAKEVQGYELYAVTGGAEALVLKTSVTYFSEPPAPPAYVATLKSPTETRKIGVTLPDGGRTEYVIAKDALFTMSLPQACSAYLDPEGTIPAGAGDTEGQDVEIYVKEDPEVSAPALETQ